MDAQASWRSCRVHRQRNKLTRTRQIVNPLWSLDFALDIRKNTHRSFFYRAGEARLRLSSASLPVGRQAPPRPSHRLAVRLARLLAEHRSGVRASRPNEAVHSVLEKHPLGVFFNRAGEARTRDLTVPNRAFYLLNYGPIERIETKTLREAQRFLIRVFRQDFLDKYAGQKSYSTKSCFGLLSEEEPYRASGCEAKIRPRAVLI